MFRISRPVALLVILLFGLAGCGDDPAAPADESGVDGIFPASEAEVIADGDATILRLVGIGFPDGGSSLDAADMAVLDRFVEVFRRNPDHVYEVQGHTDERGTEASNLQLTQAQADNVRAYLVDEVGGPAAAITAVGYGESVPLDPAHTAAAWAKNRRIEVVMRAAGSVTP